MHNWQEFSFTLWATYLPDCFFSVQELFSFMRSICQLLTLISKPMESHLEFSFLCSVLPVFPLVVSVFRILLRDLWSLLTFVYDDRYGFNLNID